MALQHWEESLYKWKVLVVLERFSQIWVLQIFPCEMFFRILPQTNSFDTLNLLKKNRLYFCMLQHAELNYWGEDAKYVNLFGYRLKLMLQNRSVINKLSEHHQFSNGYFDDTKKSWICKDLSNQLYSKNCTAKLRCV